MKLIESSVELLKQEPDITGINKMIELAGRTCYKSEANITENSAEEFVNRMINSKHMTMLEHGTVYLVIPMTTNHTGFSENHYRNNPYSKFKESKGLCMRDEYGDECDCWCITTNLRVLIENNWLDDLEYLCEPTEFHERRITLKFTTDRGVSHELVRHRVFSFAQESTRYCNYSKDKFGNEITFIKPSWMDCPEGTIFLASKEVWTIRPNNITDFLVIPDKPGYLSLIEVLARSEFEYSSMIREGLSPQQARQVLPNALKTEIVMTGFASDWKHFFDLRLFGTTGKPHPDMLFLAEKAKKVLEENELWDYIMLFPSKFD